MFSTTKDLKGSDYGTDNKVSAGFGKVDRMGNTLYGMATLIYTLCVLLLNVKAVSSLMTDKNVFY